MERLNILPQNIYKFKCSDHKMILDVLYHLENERWQKNKVNYYTVDSLLHKNSTYYEICNWFYECIQQVKNDLQMECDELKITQCWANKSHPNEWHHPHTHPNSIVSGIFYVNNSNSNTWFSIPSIWNSFKPENDSLDTIIDTVKLLYDDFQIRTVHKQQTVQGDLIIFPSSLYHSADEHLIPDCNRYSISFNTFPSGKIGKISHMSNIEIDVK